MSSILADETIKVIGFSLINHNTDETKYCCVNINQVKEIIPVTNLIQVMDAKDYVIGIISHEDMVIPIMSLKERLGFSDNDDKITRKSRIILIECNEDIIGILVDEIKPIKKIAKNEIRQPPRQTFNSINYVEGITKVGDTLLSILNFKAISDESNFDYNTENKI